MARNREQHFIMTKNSVHQKIILGLTYKNLHIYKENRQYIVMRRNFNTLLSVTHNEPIKIQ